MSNVEELQTLREKKAEVAKETVDLRRIPTDFSPGRPHLEPTETAPSGGLNREPE